MKISVKSKNFTQTSLWLLVPFLLLVPSIAWIWQDNGSWCWDQAAYADCSVRLYALLKSHGKDWLNGMISIDGYRAPD